MERSTAKVVGMDGRIPKSKSRFSGVNNRRDENRAVKRCKNLNRERLEEVTRILDECGVNYVMKSKFHIRIGEDINYYPGKGTIYLDGDFEKLEETGIGALKQVLREYDII